jgi:hypothetical protein
MKHFPKYLTLLALACLALSAQAKPLRLWGQLLADDASHTQGRLILSSKDTLLTDASGNFALDALQAGRYQLRVETEGFPLARFDLAHYHEAFLPLNLKTPRPVGLGRRACTESFSAWHPLATPLRLSFDPLLHSVGFAPEALLPQAQQGLFLNDPSDLSSNQWFFAQNRSSLSPVLQSDSRQAGLMDLGRSALYHATLTRQPTQISVESIEAGYQIQEHLSLDLGLWNQIALHSRNSHSDWVWSERRSSSQSLEHRWLFASGARLWHEISHADLDLSDLSRTISTLYYSTPAAFEIRALDQSREQLRYRLGLDWDLSEDSRFALRASIEDRDTQSTAQEFARLGDRIPESHQDHAIPEVYGAWFPTKRLEKELCLQVGAALEVRHERGELKTGLWLWQRQQDLEAALLPAGALPTAYRDAGLSSWYAHEKQRMNLGAHVADRYALSDRFSVEARLDLRYRYFRYERKEVGFYALNQVDHLHFSEDLLSLEPRFSIDWKDQKTSLSLWWRRSRPTVLEAHYWEAQSSPEHLNDEPLLSVLNSSAVVQNRFVLAKPLNERFGLSFAQDENWKLNTFVELRYNRYQAYADSVNLYLDEFTQRADESPLQRVFGLDAELKRNFAPRLSAYLGLSLRHSRDAGVIYIPTSDEAATALNVDGKALVGVPKWACTLGTTLQLPTYFGAMGRLDLSYRALGKRYLASGERLAVSGQRGFHVDLDMHWKRVDLSLKWRRSLTSVSSYAWLVDSFDMNDGSFQEPKRVDSWAEDSRVKILLTWSPFVRP